MRNLSGWPHFSFIKIAISLTINLVINSTKLIKKIIIIDFLYLFQQQAIVNFEKYWIANIGS